MPRVRGRTRDDDLGPENAGARLQGVVIDVPVLLDVVGEGGEILGRGGDALLGRVVSVREAVRVDVGGWLDMWVI